MTSASSTLYFDISIDNVDIGRIVCELFEDKAPKATKNFKHLCNGDTTIEGFKNLTFKGNYFHRIIKTFIVQCGDIVYGSDKFEKSDEIGTGGSSIYATAEEIKDETKELKCYGNFDDENLGEFKEPFLLAMANTGEANTNSSQFFITVGVQPHLNGKHTIFGKVLFGKHVVRTIENVSIDKDGFPEQCVLVKDCGIWDESMGVPLYNACNDKIGGDVYEEDPNDDSNFDHDNFEESYNASNIIKESGSLLFKKKDFKNSLFKYQKSLRYVNEFMPDMDMDKNNCLKFTTLKSKLYLNMSLNYYNLKMYDECMTYANYLLDLDNIPDIDQAKAYYRRGNSYLMKKRYEDALASYKLCKEKNPEDKVIDQKIESVKSLIEANIEKTRKNLSKFFTDPK
ncbi:hypothetical protein TPHA_0B03970 [Tetrapisispora phaffii CBS 4417]|uniref:peptidylprolyl isomerase n=1 Tax=Tetrapisispora phaffii (strain ATCC 24235 / CBS 4417 / NBRC 1672 / NRRL Y-8282 / UCD 70-5) TaxID=1071381 RepID=G8BPY8_TETPH|nr:hypothetical protein TPHA_0B03970 [Tetrapisispora phaffii CBS 4417]CCE62069.1 hypothetical protein TPHA_0B03970 [Tetrapisispora phaffii CBS 4417]